MGELVLSSSLLPLAGTFPVIIKETDYGKFIQEMDFKIVLKCSCHSLRKLHDSSDPTPWTGSTQGQNTTAAPKGSGKKQYVIVMQTALETAQEDIASWMNSVSDEHKSFCRPQSAVFFSDPHCLESGVSDKAVWGLNSERYPNTCSSCSSALQLSQHDCENKSWYNDNETAWNTAGKKSPTKSQNQNMTRKK